MSPSTRYNSKYLVPTTTTTTTSSSTYHSDSDQSDSSPRGSISLATSDDNLLPPRSHTPVSTAAHSGKAVPHHPRRPASRNVHFAEKAHLTTAVAPPIYPPLNKTQKAKQVATSTLKGAGSIAGGIFGCICYVFAKACILDGGAGLSGSGSRVVVARGGEEGFTQGNRRVVNLDMRGYYGDEKQRAVGHRSEVPTRVKVAHPPGGRSQRSAVAGTVQRSYRAH